jgi:predicted TIM-barrel fold metal-dependent hydrolase
MQWKRRHWFAGLAGAAATVLGSGCSRPGQKEAETKAPGAKAVLPIEQYEPKSMLHAAETKVPRARFPVIDIHTHLTWVNPRDLKVTHNGTVEETLATMDRKNIRTLVNVTGGSGEALTEVISHWQTPHPDRFIVFTEPSWSRASEPDYPKFQGDQIEKAHQAGARGLKVLKTLGLFLRDGGPDGKLVKVDDPRFDPMWEAAGALKMPVTIHTSDPEAFFLPIDRFNERYEELNAHPDWSFYGRDFPSNRDLQEARARVIARHPKTQFIALHVADSEDLAYTSSLLDKYPNMSVEIAARIGELGRQPRASRKFFEKYQDRILFGTDAVPHGDEYPQQVYGDLLYEIYYRFLETEDEYFDYAPARIPPQGRWRIYGLSLPEGILKKVYNGNAARLLNLKV